MRTTTNAPVSRRVGVQLLAFGAVWCGFGLVCGPVEAQQAREATPQMQRPVTIDARKTSLLEVVSQLMKQVHANYTLDGQLQDAQIGAIHLEKVPFQTALEIALKASGRPATYQLESGVFMVVARVEKPETRQDGSLLSPGQPGFMPGLGRTIPSAEPQISISDAGTLNQPRIKLFVQNGDLYTTLKALFRQAGVQFTLDPSNLRSIYVTANISQPFQNALETLLRASGQPLTYKVENDVYSIVPKPASDQ